LLGERFGWHFIRVRQKMGWIHSHHVTAISLQNLSLRDAPHLESSKLSDLDKGVHLLILGEQQGWSQIRADNRLGWVRSSGIHPRNLPGFTMRPASFRKGPGLQYDSLRMLDSETNFLLFGEKHGWYLIWADGHLGWIEEKLAKTMHLIGKVMTECALRKGLAAFYEKLSTVDSGEYLIVQGEDNGWYQVHYEGRSHWLKAKLIVIAEQLGKTVRATDLRGGPGPEYPHLRTLQLDANVILLGELADWYYVRVGMQRGWIQITDDRGMATCMFRRK